ncbi:MAG: UDP-N-acetylmuramoyl-tripeptide--D-alanyl-D-alanine ligase [Eubacterium sp.]|nr:UDP-N-acetylmuramoyl-tripeptide--D-alanyl-D-alanine ligase [Eubacterium sp.]
MEPITIGEVCKAVKGELAWGDPAGMVTGVYTDSREVGPGNLFVPIIGARVNAHEFIPEVLKQGAACVIASERDYMGETGAGIYVEDTVQALQDLAAWYRRRFDIPVVGVTGSVGKTSTKEMIGAVLEKKYNTLITYKNMNSQVGLPLMMFHLDSSVEMAVFEMGISIPGEMNRLVDIAAPEAAVMTNIGVSHIGNLGSRENICAEKGHIIREFSDNGKLFACGNGDLYDMIRKNIPYECCEGHCGTFFYGIKSEFTGDAGSLTYYADNIRAGENGEIFTFHYPEGEIEVSLSVRGEHNVTNAMAALAVGLNYGVPIEAAAAAVGAYKPLSMRGEIREVNGIHLIDDTYNASPDSIRSNLRALFSYPDVKRRIAVLGDVLELGERSEELHRSVGEYIESEAEKGRRLDALFTVGNESEAIVKYLTENTDIPATSCKDNFELANAVRDAWRPGDWILFKGSRGMHLDEVVGALMRTDEEDL